MEETTQAGASVSAHMWCLRACGYLRLRPPPAPGPAPPALRRRAHELYCAFVLAVIVLYLVQECIYAFQVRSDMEALSRVMFLLLCHVTSLAKQLVLLGDSRAVHAVLHALDDPLLNAGGTAAQARRGSSAAGARRLQRWYSRAALVTCALWALFAARDRARARPVTMPFYVPFDYSSVPRFACVLVYSFYVTSLVGIANTTMDALAGAVLSQCRAQLATLCENFSTLTERARESADTDAGDREEGEEGKARYERVLMRMFVDNLRHYRKITDINRSLMEVFGVAILIQFSIGGWILCMAAYKLVSLNVMSIEFLSMTLFILCILTELFVYCYYGNQVTFESARVSDAVAGCGWVGAPRALQRSLPLALLHTRRDLTPTAARVVPLSLNTFRTILKSSYTFYAVLRQTK